MTNLYMGGEDLPDDYTDENGVYEYKVQTPNTSGENIDIDTNETDKTWENESTRDTTPQKKNEMIENIFKRI